MKINEISKCLEEFAPLNRQESYDNSGLIVGDLNTEINAVLLSLDCTEAVIEEAIEKKAGLVISHHPVIFSGLKRLNGSNYVDRTVIKAIKNNIAIYASHTNLDKAYGGVNFKIAEKLGLQNVKVLDPVAGKLKKLAVYCPKSQAEIVRKAMFEAGAGNISEYSECSFNSAGIGTFKAGLSANPYSGEIGKIQEEEEVKVEVILHDYNAKDVIRGMVQAHPYEEVAYDLYALENVDNRTGLGAIGRLDKAVNTLDFLNQVKSTFSAACLRHTEVINSSVQKIAVCGGSGSFLLNKAIGEGADLFISSDFKYHQFFDADKKITIADIGHYEGEQFTTELLYDILIEKFPTFAFHFSEVKTNPVNYL